MGKKTLLYNTVTKIIQLSEIFMSCMDSNR